MGRWRHLLFAGILGLWLGTWLSTITYPSSFPVQLSHQNDGVTCRFTENNTAKPAQTHPSKPAEPSAHSSGGFSGARWVPKEREEARRKVENMAAELFYFLDGAVDQIKKSASGDVTLSRAISSVADQLQGYQTAMSRDLTSLSQVEKDDEWRAAQSKRLGELVQRRLEFLQNPPDCAKARLLVCEVVQQCGLGCQLNHVTFCLIVAYATRRTLVPDTFTMDTAIWTNLFKPLSSCVGTAYSRGMPWSAIPEDLAPRLTAFHGEPGAWWVGQLLRYITRPSASLEKQINSTASVLGFQRPIVGVHVRRGDKVKLKEASFHHLDEYMRHVDNYFRRISVTSTKRRVFLATDDPSLFQEAKIRYPDYTFMSNTSATLLGAHGTLRMSEQGLVGAIIDIVLLSHSDYLVCTLSSNVGRVAYSLMQTHHGDASRHFRSLDDVFYFHGGNPLLSHAIYNHTRRQPGELSFQESDIFKIHGNHWNGMTKVTLIKTGEVGLIPSYKVVSEVTVAKLPTYSEVKENV